MTKTIRRSADPKPSAPSASTPIELPKCPTGISGFDEITRGGLPRGRPSLVCGAAGCGKTLFGLEFLVRGAVQFGEPGVHMAFEERPEELKANVVSLGFDLEDLVNRKLLVLDHVRVERSEIEETGEYNLDGLFIRLGYAIDTIGAKRVVLDTIESLFSGLSNTAILRAELRRLFVWLKDKGVTAVITGERGDGQLTRQGLEEYVSDSVILLDHRVTNQVSTRRLRIVKYRGSTHGTNEYPFLIESSGIVVMPITSAGLAHSVSDERLSSGTEGLDEMLGGGGFFRGSSVLVSGTAGTGKSSISAHFARSVAAGGERCLYFAFEESPGQIVRNMRSIGVDLEPAIKSGLLRVSASRPTLFGLEAHLASMHKQVGDFDPAAVIIDPLSALIEAGSIQDVEPMILRIIDFLKARNVTALLTSLSHGGDALEATRVGISSLMDTWILLRDIEFAGERNRGIYILKSRGMNHSNQIREFTLSDRGIRLIDAYLGDNIVLTGSARLAQEGRDREEEEQRRRLAAARRAESVRKEAAVRAQIAVLEAELASISTAVEADSRSEAERIDRANANQAKLSRSRRVVPVGVNGHAAPPRPKRRSS